GVGIFVFTNRTYNGGSSAAWAAARILQKAGALVDRDKPVSPLLADGYAAAGRIYAAGDIMAAQANLAMNMLMDSDAAHWSTKLAGLKGEVGACATDAPITASGNLSGSFTWTCDRGRVAGTILLAPTRTAQIQELNLAVKAP
ncbi:MAG: penicillin-binding protein, partial [bacterium]|nr:penicillin-binding protein [bacterium]